MLLAEPPCCSGQAALQSLGEHEPFLFYPTSEVGRMLGQIRLVAPRETTLLLTGETGTGKTHLARLIHELSPRRNLPFLVVNCGALSATLIESELFGHIKGAFTGADRDRTGKFSEVSSGTLVLDEIDALPLSLQSKLLRAVEERIFEPVGSNKSQPMKARLIAASNRALETEVASGNFRSDLYYRLNVVSFTLPPLRERRDAIVPIARQFIAEFSARTGRAPLQLSHDVIAVLERYRWPGNVRELRNVVERAVALCTGPTIRLDDLPESVFLPTPAPIDLPGAGPAAALNASAATLARTTAEAEMARIVEVLMKHRNNRLRAAHELGISRMTLYKKLHKYGLMGAA